MSVQVRTDITNQAFILEDPALTVSDQTFLQDAARTEPLEPNTVLAKNSDGKWVPLTDETATDGTERPVGISTKQIAAADLVAGDVTGQVVYVQIPLCDKNQMVLENSLTLATYIDTLKITIEEALRQTNIFVEDTVDIDGFENS